ncbi:MAG: EAL domain-containing protein [Candidatus Eremiobacteraeota bacterium]|nr:EAL domain-containing protein [Candidatus Eremiobacteraeota bacterium]MCW5871897.1 EAL domain-containing protein [Candidatus Eremiobacteraeota bacterium]
MARKKRKTNDPVENGGDVAVVEEEELSDLEAVLDHDPNGLMVVETESRQVLWANRSAERMFKKKREKLLNEPFPEELEEGPMRTLDLNRQVSTLTWQGQDATLLVLTTISSNSASFSTEWRLEAAEERAREAEEQVAQLQGLLQEARKAAKVTGGDASLKEQLAKAEERASAAEKLLAEASDAEARAQLASVQERATQLEQALARAEERAGEAETLLEETSQSESTLKKQLKEAEERAQAAESLLDEASAGGAELQSLRDHEAELKAELEAAQARTSQVEQELRAVESRVDLAEERAKEAEQLMEEAESQARETERHLEDVQDSVRQVEEQLEAALAELAAEKKLRELSGGAARIQDLTEQVEILREELETARAATKKASAELSDWEEREAQWKIRESEVEELELVHLQVITELEQLREERQNWQEAQASQTVEPGELEKLQEQVRELQERLDFLEVERSELEEKWVESRTELEQAQQRGLELESAAQLAQAQQDKAQAELLERLEKLSAEMEDLKNARDGESEQLQVQLLAAQEQISELSGQLSAAQDECTNVQVELATAQEHWAESQTQVNESQTALLQAQAQIQDIQAQFSEAQAQISTSQALVTELQAENEKLTARLSDSDSAEKSLASRLEEQLAELQLESADLHEKLTESEGTARSTLEELALARQQLEQMQHVSGEFDDVQQHLISVEKERDELLRHLDETEVELEKARGEVAEMSSRLEAKTAEAEAQAAALSDLENQLDAAEEARKTPSAEAETLKASLTAGEEKARLLQEQLDEMIERVELADKLETEVFLLRGQVDEQAQQLQLLRESAGRVTELEAKVSELEAPQAPDPRIAELETELTRVRADHEARVAELEAALVDGSGPDPRLAELEAKAAELEAALLDGGAPDLRVAELEAAVAQARADADARVAELEDLLEQASNFEPEVTRLKGELAAAHGRIDELQGTSVEPRVPELEAEVLRLQAELDGARAGGESSAEVVALQAQLATLQQQQALAVPAGEGAGKETEQLAFEDSLTRLPNLNLLKRYLDFSLKQVDRYQRKCALVHVDLDRFAALNEALGPEAGDEVLRQVGERLQKVVRTSDVLCRKNEDDFLILLSEVAGEADAPQSISIVLKRIQEVLAPPIIAGGQPVLVTASIGVSQFPSDAEDGEKMMVHAYESMRRAKELGRNQVQFYTDELQKRHEARATLEAELRKGVEARQFQLLYQPIVHLATGAIKGVESLLRWAHPSYGVLTPDYFLEVADETGVMVPLGRWVILQAAQQLYEWSRQGLDLFVTVNLSTRQFLQADLVDTIRRALESTGAPAHNFVVEIPESVQMLDIQRVQGILLALRQAGVRVALDRFGSGFSSLERIHSELTTLIKVDRKFLFHSASNAAALNVTAAAMALARVLRVRPVAVGVENAAQLSLCRQLECEYVQGNLVYIPTDAAQISELARAGRLLR